MCVTIYGSLLHALYTVKTEYRGCPTRIEEVHGGYKIGERVFATNSPDGAVLRVWKPKTKTGIRSRLSTVEYSEPFNILVTDFRPKIKILEEL